MYLQDYLAAAKRRRDIKANAIAYPPPCSTLDECLAEAELRWYCTPHVVQSICVPEQSEGAYLPMIVDKNNLYPSCVDTEVIYCRAFNDAFDDSFG